MDIPIEQLTPRQIVDELDRYIVGQEEAKKAVAVAIRNRYRRQQLSATDREDILPKNILMIGPTGVGKTEIARRVAQLVRAPFMKVEATKFTEVGYVGRDVESMIRDLTAVAVRLVEKEKIESVYPEAEKRALESLVNLLDEGPKINKQKNPEGLPFDPESMKEMADLLGKSLGQDFKKIFHIDQKDFSEDHEEADDHVSNEPEVESVEDRQKRRKKLLKAIIAGKYDDKEVDVEIEDQSNPFFQVFTAQGIEEMGIEGGALSNALNMGRKATRSMSVHEAKALLTEQHAKKMIDGNSINREAIIRTEQTSIIFLDEIDKIAIKRGGNSGPDVSREGVQRDLLPIIEGSTVATKYGPVKTDHILFITAGAFHTTKPSDLIPELQGRLPIRVELENLSEDDFKKILKEPKNALIVQYQKLLAVEGVNLEFTPDAIDEIAHFAQEVNNRIENIGARRLHTLLEKILEEPLFEAPEIKDKHLKIDVDYVQSKLKNVIEDTDLSRYIL